MLELRSLDQSVARELAPKTIHVVHFVIDGAILPDTRVEPEDKPDSLLNPDALAEAWKNQQINPEQARDLLFNQSASTIK